MTSASSTLTQMLTISTLAAAAGLLDLEDDGDRDELAAAADCPAASPPSAAPPEGPGAGLYNDMERCVVTFSKG
jgi:hypothetical protein